MLGFPNLMSSFSARWETVPGPISYSLSLPDRLFSMGFAAGTPAMSPAPTSLMGISAWLVLVMIHAVKKDWTRAAISVLSVYRRSCSSCSITGAR